MYTYHGKQTTQKAKMPRQSKIAFTIDQERLIPAKTSRIIPGNTIATGPLVSTPNAANT